VGVGATRRTPPGFREPPVVAAFAVAAALDAPGYHSERPNQHIGVTLTDIVGVILHFVKGVGALFLIRSPEKLSVMPGSYPQGLVAYGKVFAP